MTSQSVFLVVPSNSEAKSYPENNTSNFTVPLPYSITFGKGWKVALLEIQLPMTFYNLDDNLRQNRITLVEGTEEDLVNLTPGLYTTADSLIEEVNERIADSKLNFRQFKYEKVTRKVYIQLRENQKIKFSSRIASILSLPDTLKYSPSRKSTKTFKSKTQIDPWRDFHHLFVYSDIVENSVLNDSMTPLLQTVNVPSNQFGSLLVRSYFPPEFIGTRYEHYSALKVWIRNEAQDFVRFRSGPVVLKLLITNGGSSRNESGLE